MRILQDLRKLLVISFILMLASCNRMGEEQIRPMDNLAGARKGVSPSLAPPVGGCPEGEVWDNVLGECVRPTSSCTAVSSSSVNTTARNRAVAVYGTTGGTRYDQLKNYSYSATTVINNFSYKAWDYTQQIRKAIVDGSNAYAAAAGTSTAYSGTTYLSYLNSYLTPVKNAITNDATLSSNEKNVLLPAFDAIAENFSRTSSLVNNNLDCFPTPSGIYASGPVAVDGTNQGPSLSVNGAGQVVAASWFGNALRKVVNIVATVLVHTVQNAVAGAVFGAIIGTAGGPWGTFLGFAYGALIGGLKGFTDGVNASIRGEFVCVYGPCY